MKSQITIRIENHIKVYPSDPCTLKWPLAVSYQPCWAETHLDQFWLGVGAKRRPRGFKLAPKSAQDGAMLRPSRDPNHILSVLEYMEKQRYEQI